MSGLNPLLEYSEAVFVASAVIFELSLFLSLQQKLISLALSCEGVALVLVALGPSSKTLALLILDYLRQMMMLAVSLNQAQSREMT